MQDETAPNPGRPKPDEYNSYYEQYVNLVPDGATTDLLANQLNTTLTLLSSLSPSQASYRPKPEDWNIVEVMGHLADSERVFAYRALRFARNDTTPLASFDQDLFVATANFARRPLLDVLDEFAAVRRATLALFRGLDEAAWLRRGSANNSEVSVRALAYIIAGHELHHVADFRQRYQLAG
ncbi:MAG: DinB family protein [Chloroflexi bacterium]|nr:MAG: DinB family protein [Chloroflexota bacterium]